MITLYLENTFLQLSKTHKACYLISAMRVRGFRLMLLYALDQSLEVC